jgi:cation diffusion facilitator family transporter
MDATLEHHHGLWHHSHHHHGPHRHVLLLVRSTATADHDHAHEHHHHGSHGHEHTHGRIDPSIVRSRAGVRAVAWSLLILGVTAAVQAVVFVMSGSVALFSDLIHNGGDALTAIPLAFAFLTRSARAERGAGYFVVATIFVSAVIAVVESIDRIVHPQHLDHLVPLAIAGLVGFAGNELAAQVRLRAGARLDSPALVADGHHARVDGFVSLGVVVSAVLVAAGFHMADPIVGLAIAALILRITWQAWTTIRADDHHHH